MALGPSKKVVLGSVAFAIFWILAVFPAVPFLPIGRTAGSILGATLMVIFEVITPEQAYDAINLPVLGLLFGTMVVSIYLERADMFKDLGVLFSWKSWGAKDMLCRICIVSAISSALFTNDTACVFLTEFILKIARENNVRPEPFLLGLASSSNIGSSATPIGNPQNLIIAIQSRISFGEFVLGLLPAVLVGVFVNALILICMFWRLLSDVKEEEDALEELIVQEDSESGPQQSAEESNGLLNRWERLSRKLCIYLGTVGMLVAFLKGVDMSWTALTTALIFVILDFKDAGPCLEKVSYSVLVLFCGMFITVDGFNRTGIPSSFWNLMEPHARIDHASGIAVLAIVILLLSNVASNVPTEIYRVPPPPHKNIAMDAEDDWESSSGEVTDTDQFNDEDFYSTSACLSKLQFRSDVSKAKWNVEMGMAEVIEKKGKMWITTGIVRNGKTFCLIEETLFLAEIGALLVMDDNDECLALKDIYKKISEERNGCSWELFEVYKHLKSLGYVVGRHGVPWSIKGVKNNSKPCSSQGTIQNNRVEGAEENGITCTVQMLSNLQVDELRLNFDVYLPNSKFRKSSPGDPAFLLCLVRGSPPANAKSEVLERQCAGIPLKLCHVDHGRVSFFSFKRVELPILP